MPEPGEAGSADANRLRLGGGAEAHRDLVGQEPSRPGEHHPLPRRADNAQFLDTLTTPIVFLASIPIAYAFGANWARLTCAALIVIGPISGRIAARRVRRILSEESPVSEHPRAR